MKKSSDYPIVDVRPQDDPSGIYYIFSGEWSIIDNFAPTPVIVDVGFGKIEYATSEHAFAAAKARNRIDHDKVAGCLNTGGAKAIGRRIELRHDWEDIKFAIMWRVLLNKFSQNGEAAMTLINTEDRVIYEGNTWADRIWGVTSSGSGFMRGQNALGFMLMEIREIIKESGPSWLVKLIEKDQLEFNP